MNKNEIRNDIMKANLLLTALTLAFATSCAINPIQVPKPRWSGGARSTTNKVLYVGNVGIEWHHEPGDESDRARCRCEPHPAPACRRGGIVVAGCALLDVRPRVRLRGIGHCLLQQVTGAVRDPGNRV